MFQYIVKVNRFRAKMVWLQPICWTCDFDIKNTDFFYDLCLYQSTCELKFEYIIENVN